MPYARPRRRRWPTGCPDPPPPLEAVVGPLAEGAADRMDRRQIEHVEAHGGDVRQAPVTSQVPCSRSSLDAGTRKQLVPGGEARALGIDRDREDVP